MKRADKENVTEETTSKYGRWGEDPRDCVDRTQKSKKSTCSSAVEKAKDGKRCVANVLTRLYSMIRGTCKKHHKRDESLEEMRNPWITTRKRDEKAEIKTLSDVTSRYSNKPREII